MHLQIDGRLRDILRDIQSEGSVHVVGVDGAVGLRTAFRCCEGATRASTTLSEQWEGALGSGPYCVGVKIRLGFH